MIDSKFIESLIRLLDESSIDNLEIERGGTRIRISKSPDVALAAAPVAVAASPVAAAPAPTPAVADLPVSAPAAAPSNLVDVTSPMVGTFYRAPGPDADSYVEIGKQVGEGDVLCIIEAMKLMNELECETSGKISEICVQDGDPVEFGQVLFRVEPV